MVCCGNLRNLQHSFLNKVQTPIYLSNMTTVISESVGDTKKLARKLAAAAKHGDVFLLNGDLGAGKTEFARAFINYFTQCEVTSPTYNIVKEYMCNQHKIFHFDLYRIDHEQELEEIGLFDAFAKGISLIEWPNIAVNFLPKNAITIDIKITDNKRVFEIN